MEDIEKVASPKRAPHKKIQVTYPNGEVICYGRATMTFMEFLRRIDKEKLPLIKLEMSHLPLISQVRYPQYEQSMRTIHNGWYVNTHGSDSETMYRQMRLINEQLGLNLQLAIGSDLETSKTKGFHNSGRTVSCLLVKFQDGHFVGETSPKETYIEAIRHIGVEEVKKKRIEISGRDLITTAKKYSNQVEVTEGKWLTIPELTKEKVKWLRIIAAHMRNNMEISMI